METRSPQNEAGLLGAQQGAPTKRKHAWGAKSGLARTVHEMGSALWFWRAMPLPPGRATEEGHLYVAPIH
jgi:hypothetical protein